MMLSLDQYRKVCNRVCTMLRKRNPFMEGIRSDGFKTIKKTPPAGSEEMDIASFGNAVIALMRDQSPEALLHQATSTWGYTENPVSSGSMSPDFGEMWRYGCPKSPDWDGDLELDSVEEDERERVEDRLRQVIESPLLALVREFLTSDDVLNMRTTAVKWNTSVLYGPFAELFFFLLKKDGREKPVPPPEWPVAI